MKEEYEIPENWECCRVNEIGIVQTGTTPSKKNPKFYSKDYPFYKPSDLDAGINVINSIDGLSEQGIEEARFVPEFSTLVTCIGATIGKTGFIKKGGGFNQQINSVTPFKNINPKFVYFQTISHFFQSQILKNASATTLPIINKRKFELLKMFLCPINEQHRIVAKIEELLSSLDKGIESLKTAQQQLKVYRQSVLKFAFEGTLTNTKVVLTTLDQLIEPPKYGTSKKCGYGIKGKAVLRIPNIRNGIIDITDLKFAKFDSKEIEAYSLKEGDILTIRSNGSVDLVGKCSIITEKNEDYLFAGYLIRLRSIRSKVDSKFLLHALSSHNLRTQIEGKAKSTSGVNNINSEEIKSLLVPICNLKEQHLIVKEIESRLSICDKIEESILQGLLQAEALRQSILKKAFEGKLVPQDPNDEPASRLLERIKTEKEKLKKETIQSKVKRGKIVPK